MPWRSGSGNLTSKGTERSTHFFKLPYGLYITVLLYWCVLLFLPACAEESIVSGRHYHPEKGFRNLEDYEAPGFLDFLRWRWQRLFKEIPSPESYDFQSAKTDAAFLRSDKEQTTLTWIGHATVLLQLGGKNILTDPHFSSRASPVQWAGPARFVPPGLSLDDLPPIHIVVISHDHYDSLDKRSIYLLRQRAGGDETMFFVPMGLKGWFLKQGVERVKEMDWWQKEPYEGVEMIAIPVKHWSKRSVFSRNKTLWAGWIIRSEGFSFLFAGDTGYTSLFKEIGDRFGPFSLAAIPIGAYEPRWFMRHHHISPEEAVQVHLDVRAEQSVAIHWGTFILTDEPLDEPPKRLKKARDKRGLAKEDFRVLKHGETIVVKAE